MNMTLLSQVCGRAVGVVLGAVCLLSGCRSSRAVVHTVPYSGGALVRVDPVFRASDGILGSFLSMSNVNVKLHEPRGYAVLKCEEVAAPVIEGAPGVRASFLSLFALPHVFYPDDTDSGKGRAGFDYYFAPGCDVRRIRSISGKVRVFFRREGSPVSALLSRSRGTAYVPLDGQKVELRWRKLKQEGLQVEVRSPLPLASLTFSQSGRSLSVNCEQSSRSPYLTRGDEISGGSCYYVCRISGATGDVRVQMSAYSGPVYTQILPFRVVPQ